MRVIILELIMLLLRVLETMLVKPMTMVMMIRKDMSPPVRVLYSVLELYRRSWDEQNMSKGYMSFLNLLKNIFYLLFQQKKRRLMKAFIQKTNMLFLLQFLALVPLCFAPQILPGKGLELSLIHI